MTTPEDLRAQAVAQIEAAFAETPAPSPEGDWHTFYECADLKTEWHGKHWRDVTADLIVHQRDCLSFLRPDAFRFFLPAYLISVLLHPDTVSTLVDEIVRRLSPSAGQPFSSWHNQQLAAQVQAVSPTEAQAVLAFFEAYKTLWDGEVLIPMEPDQLAELGVATHFWTAVRDKTPLPITFETPFDQRREAYKDRRIFKDKQITAFRVPTPLGLRPPAPDRIPGTYKAPDALMNAGLLVMLNAIDGGRIEVDPYAPEIEPETNVRNRRGLCRQSWFIAQMVESLTPVDVNFQLLIGGDCSLLLGAALGLKRVGRYGLIFMDGHTDFQTPETSASKAAAGMDLALVTGYGPDALTNMEGRKPYIRESDVVVFGNRDIEDRETYYAKAIFETDISMITLDYARQVGVEMAAHQAVELLRQRGVQGFWIHLDADVLDSTIMPAVDSPMPGGLSYAELITALRVFLSSGLAVGMEITIYDPDLDPDGSIARAYVDALVEAFHFDTP